MHDVMKAFSYCVHNTDGQTYNDGVVCAVLVMNGPCSKSCLTPGSGLFISKAPDVNLGSEEVK